MNKTLFVLGKAARKLIDGTWPQSNKATLIPRCSNDPTKAMKEFEIRILRYDGSTEFVIGVAKLDGYSAVCAGRRFANGMPFEIWHRGQRVYAGTAPQRAVLKETTDE